MSYEIRPMSLGEILDTGLRLVRDHFVLLVGISAVAYVPLQIAQDLFLKGVIVASPGKLPQLGPSLLWMLAIGLLFIALFPVVAAAETFALGEVYLGRTTGLGASYRESFRIFGPLMGTLFLYSLALLLVLLPLLPIVYLARLNPLAIVLCPLPLWAAFYLMARFLLVNQVIVLERTFGFPALRRSWELMYGNLWRAIGILFVCWVLATVLSFAANLVFALVPFARGLGGGLVQSLAFAYLSAVSVVLYFDIRCRKEAFELEHLARLVGEHGGPASPATA
jgi:hypothetical protein